VIGALLRWLQAVALHGAAGGDFPLGTFVANVVGSLVVATFLGLLLQAATPHPLWRPFFAVGVCGAYTTLSAFAGEAVALASRGQALLGAGYVAYSLAAGLVGAHVGALLARSRRRDARALVVVALSAPLLALLASAALGPGALPDLRELPRDVAVVAAGGAGGAVVRFAVGGWVAERTEGLFPWGTLVVNLTGCLLMGLFGGAMQHAADVPAWLPLLVTTGFLGGYTTFSTLCFETDALLSEGARRYAVANLAASVLGGIAGIVLGHWIGGSA
jgi:CrcB protein